MIKINIRISNSPLHHLSNEETYAPPATAKILPADAEAKRERGDPRLAKAVIARVPTSNKSTEAESDAPSLGFCFLEFDDD